MMKDKQFYNYDYIIRPDEIDLREKLKPTEVLNFLQNSAANHAEMLNCDYYSLLPQNVFWVIYSIHLRMKDYPTWRDTFSVKTWPTGYRKLFALRDFQFFDNDKAEIGRAHSQWLILNKETHRPSRKHDVYDRLKPYLSPEIQDWQIESIPSSDTWTDEKHFAVRYSDMDLNQHVNNRSYFEWGIESLPGDILLNHSLSELDINFLSEAQFGNTMICKYQILDESEKRFLHSVCVKETGKEAARLITRWEKNKK